MKMFYEEDEAQAVGNRQGVGKGVGLVHDQGERQQFAVGGI